MADTGTTHHGSDTDGPQDELTRSITGRLLYFYVLGDVLGSGIYVLIGAVAGAVGGAFFVAFAVGVTVAKDGALLVSDDTGDCIWRVSHASPK